MQEQNYFTLYPISLHYSVAALIHVKLFQGCFVFVMISFQDDRFNHDIDARTGYKTRTLLCMPIKDFNGDVIGVAQVSLALKLV